MVAAQLPERFRKRARHFFDENRRVQEGIKAWKEGNIHKFGELVFQSGESSIINYECGCPELITIYDSLRQTPGVYGARFSGAGYRGCCIGLIDPKYKETIKEKVTKEYMPKPLLPIGEKPILEHILEDVCDIPVVDELMIITNHKFYRQFQEWEEGFLMGH